MKSVPSILAALTLALFTTAHAQTQTFRVLYNFGTHAGDPGCFYGPGFISQSLGGNLYTTSWCDTENHATAGTAFMYRLSGQVDVLHQFGPNWDPLGGLTLSKNGQFYGTTQDGGNGWGTFFSLSSGGAMTTLHYFDGSDHPVHPEGGIIQSTAGLFYGTANGTDANGNSWGVIYSMSLDGNYTWLWASHQTFGGALVQGTDGAFYGNTEVGGKYGYGDVYRMNARGGFWRLHSFGATSGQYPDDGKYPVSALVQASDGTFYGVASAGGQQQGYGLVFSITSTGVYKVVHYFTGTDGAIPFAGLTLATDGNLYGSTRAGGAYDRGVIFRLTPSGDYTVLHDFKTAAGGPQLTMIQHTNGRIYGFTPAGGAGQIGMLFRLDLGLRPFVTYLNVWGRVGAHVMILGQGFTNDSVVSFNGVTADKISVHPTYMKVTVPDGATTGPITVTNSDGTLTSNKIFRVHLDRIGERMGGTPLKGNLRVRSEQRVPTSPAVLHLSSTIAFPRTSGISGWL